MSAVLKKPRKQPKPVQCKAPGCERLFVRVRIGQKTCERYQCALAYARAEADRKAERKAQAEKRERKAKLQELKPLRYWVSKCQAAFNAFVRERDYALPCISCGRMTGAKRNAGHYLSVGAHPELRFHEDNCHSQCEHCNSWKSGNQAEYRVRLIEKIGLERVEALEGPHPPAKWTREQLQTMAAEYRAKTRELQKSRPGAFARLSAGSFA